MPLVTATYPPPGQHNPCDDLNECVARWMSQRSTPELMGIIANARGPCSSEALDRLRDVAGAEILVSAFISLVAHVVQERAATRTELREGRNHA